MQLLVIVLALVAQLTPPERIITVYQVGDLPGYYAAIGATADEEFIVTTEPQAAIDYQTLGLYCAPEPQRYQCGVAKPPGVAWEPDMTPMLLLRFAVPPERIVLTQGVHRVVYERTPEPPTWRVWLPVINP
jgi:hypothetical protein